MSAPLSQNSPAGRRSHIRVVRPVDVAAVLLHTEARAFTRRALTRLPLGVRPTVLRGPGNLADPSVAQVVERYARMAQEPDFWTYEQQRDFNRDLHRAGRRDG